MRTPVYPERVARAAGLGPDAHATWRGGAPAAAGNGPDGYADKLAKYVPAEAIAFYLPAYTQADGDGARWLVLLVGLVGTLIYLLTRQFRERNRTASFFYVLALVAFAGWAVGTSDIGTQLFGFSERFSRLLLLITVFVIPGIDQAITQRLNSGASGTG